MHIYGVMPRNWPVSSPWLQSKCLENAFIAPLNGSLDKPCWFSGPGSLYVGDTTCTCFISPTCAKRESSSVRVSWCNSLTIATTSFKVSEMTLIGSGTPKQPARHHLLNLGVAGLPRCVTQGRIVSLHHGSNPGESIKCYTTVILATFESDCASNVKSLSCNCPHLQLTAFLRLLRATPRWPMRSTCWCIHPNFSSMHQPCSESNKLLSLQAEPRIHR